MKRTPYPLPAHDADDIHDHFGLERIVFPDHHGGGDEDVSVEEDDRPLTWAFDNVELTTVGVDIGSSTSHLIFARLHLQRLQQSLSSRFAVVKREVLHRSPILLTPYREDGLIDAEALRQFIDQAYADADLAPEKIDTGAVILTGVALERANAQAVAELFADSGGKFVCASAGHNLESLLAAHGSGAVALSHRRGDTLLHVDVGGGTSKLSLIRDGDVLATAALGVGGRLVAVDERDRVVRIEPVARRLCAELRLPLMAGEPFPARSRRRLAERMTDLLAEVSGRGPLSPLAQALMLTEPLPSGNGAAPTGVTFSGGVSEFLYGREHSGYGDLGPELAASIRTALETGRLPLELVPLTEGIRATVIGASQFTVQLSGNTVHIPNLAALPLRNLPVVHPRLGTGALEEPAVAEAIKLGFRRLDLQEGQAPVALSIAWRGEPRYQSLRALAAGIVAAMPLAIHAHFPLVVALQEDIGRSLGGILEEELGVTADLISIDGLELLELDYVDIGELIQPANVVPVVIKSLAFSGVRAAVKS